MGRPTQERKDRTVKLRISEELYKEVEDLGENISETIRLLIRKGIDSNAPQKAPKSNAPQKRALDIIAMRCRTKRGQEEFESGRYGNLTILTNEELENMENNVPQNHQELMDKAVEKDINQMCRLNNISTHDFYRGVCELWNAGKLEIDGEKVVSLGKYDVRMFEETCYKNKLRPQEVLDKLTRRMEGIRD